MLRAWRITKARYADPPQAAFDGEGARRRGGRWNLAGRGMAYASESLALAVMEYFVNLTPEDAPDGLVSVQVDIPDSIAHERIAVTDLPTDWSTIPAPKELQEMGGKWLKAEATVALLVPSALIATEQNVLINPRHADFSRLSFHTALPFRFDPRMWK